MPNHYFPMQKLLKMTPSRSTVAPGAVTTFKVTFKPGAKGTRNAGIHIKSKDADENPFDISVTGLAKP